jgi:hypothetical protein
MIHHNLITFFHNVCFACFHFQRYRKHVRAKEKLTQQRNAAVEAASNAAQQFKQIG